MPEYLLQQPTGLGSEELKKKKNEPETNPILKWSEQKIQQM